ncbi:copper homeostasis protein CutC [Agromyces tropicus]|uniref:PF03932 family protein CutC n=1 Tax=Agromyces tropicus TaxID=555371 RepID=A0ABN2UR95_9MICO
MAAFELAVQDPDGVAVAARIGADRVELCTALAIGGVTPSAALIESAVAVPLGPPVHVLVRPRGGGFTYDEAEVALTVRDAAHAVRLGAAGVVVGGVRDGRVDEELVRRVRDAVGGRPVTFHRAFDVLPEQERALEQLVALGVRRVLTSGGADAAGDALPRLAALAAIAGDRIEVMAGSGVRADLVPDLLATGVHAVHASAKRLVEEGDGVALGSASGPGRLMREVTDEAEARRIAIAVRGAEASA